ncbi:Translation initiation factor IF-2 [Geodia barretti]|uniref:Translation initiation factor IF-2, chloroplastic n=1 Tax=Geodia barretti TaxID=519541 RepID=A0AA35WV00_GEOBA|nr:Translation initiation factor IF-2 [Geodia barretti]
MSSLDSDTVALIESEMAEPAEAVSTIEGSIEDTTDPSSNTAKGLRIEEGTTVAELAATLELQPSALIMQLMKLKTIEAINHAKAAKVPIVVAINKIDVPGARPDYIKQQLSEHELVPEDWGGQTICVETSAIDGTEAGDKFYAIESDRDARTISETRQDQYRTEKLGENSHVSLENLFQQIQEGEIKELNVVLKGDMQGSVQAVASSLLELSTDEVKINIIHQAVGGITETDILLASASNAIVVGFNVHPTTEAVQAKEAEGIDVRTYNVIYNLISYIHSAMEGLLDPEVREVVIGRAEVRELFKVPRLGVVAGSYVNWGRISSNQPLRILRDNRLIHEGKVNSLRRFKDNVNEVQANYECGIGIETFEDLQIGDVLECYVHEQIARSLS